MTEPRDTFTFDANPVDPDPDGPENAEVVDVAPVPEDQDDGKDTEE